MHQTQEDVVAIVRRLTLAQHVGLRFAMKLPRCGQLGIPDYAAIVAGLVRRCDGGTEPTMLGRQVAALVPEIARVG